MIDVGFPLDESQTKVLPRPLKVSQMHLQGCRTIRRRHRTKHEFNLPEGRLICQDKYETLRNFLETLRLHT